MLVRHSGTTAVSVNPLAPRRTKGLDSEYRPDRDACSENEATIINGFASVRRFVSPFR